MKRTRIAFVLPVLLALAACDGGSRGSGITTAQGNVASVQTALRAPSTAPTTSKMGKTGWLAWLWRRSELEGRAEADAGVAGIRVLVEGTTIEDETGADGSFRLRGRFEGDATLRFEQPSTGSFQQLLVNAPAGGILTLDDVHIDQTRNEVTARAQRVDFEGLVASTDCQASLADLISRHRSPTDTDVYPTRLDTSFLHDSNGVAFPCEALREGDTVRVRGSVNDDGTFGNADIER